MANKVKFSTDGSREWQQTLSVRVQSEAAVRQFGVLAFSYGSENEQVKVVYVRVRKADGSVVETPESSIQDVATEVAAAAPTYSDLRQKQIPVKALEAGDVLEYCFLSSQRKPEIPGQFWYDQSFVANGVVLNQTLEISVPKQKYVQVFSPKLQAEVHDAGDQRVYLWRHSQLETSKPEDKKKPRGEDDALRVQITTFKNWEEVGNWWTSLASPQTVVTPAIQEKATQLTAGLPSEMEKARALYEYVAMKFRYISISLGAGRYRPHSAGDVLANQYGDCKDKHTLFAALLKAAGIQAWPALIGAGIKFNADVPTPEQFNHVVTVLPQGGKYLWLDTTAEVAPFGYLTQVIRDEQALVIPLQGKPTLVKTPIDLPFAASETVEVKATLAADGTLTGHFDFRLDGDSALLLRNGFRQLAPTQWQAFAQQLSYAMSYGGDVSGVEVEDLEKIDKPLHYSYEYQRKNYSDWEGRKITPPVPPLGFGPGEEAEKPRESFWAGAPGKLTYRASVQLPKGYSIEVPQDVTVTSPFAEYSAHYSLKVGILTAERKMVIKQAKVSPEEWSQYQTFSKGVRVDQTRFLSLTESVDVQKANVSEYSPEADHLLDQAAQALQAKKLNETRDLLSQAERLSPKQARLWGMYSYVAMTSGNLEEAITDCRKEVQFHPDEISAYQQLTSMLVRAGRREEAIDAWRGALRVTPGDTTAAPRLAVLLMQAKRYQEVPAVLEKAITAAPEKYDLQVMRVKALLRGGRRDEGVSEAKKIAAATSEPIIWNDLAYELSDTDTNNEVAKEWVQQALSQTEQSAAKADLSNFQSSDLKVVKSIAAEWDTLGWVYFKENDLAAAEKYVNAAWQLSQHAGVADHLGQIYEKQGKHTAALRMWRLAIAANSSYDDARERLRNAGAPVFEPIRVGKSTSRGAVVPPAEELGTLRTIDVAALPKQTGSAEFFIVIGQEGIEDAQILAESEAFQNAAPAIRSAKYKFPFPDAGPEKIIRRAILSCSTYTTPSCKLTMLLPETVKLAQLKSHQTGSESTQAKPEVVVPTLQTKVEPEYSKAALESQLEGTVVLMLVVNADGNPEDVFVVKSLGSGLDEKARECVRKWRFRPATKDGKPVSMPARVEVNFRLVRDSQ